MGGFESRQGGYAETLDDQSDEYLFTVAVLASQNHRCHSAFRADQVAENRLQDPCVCATDPMILIQEIMWLPVRLEYISY